jgi:hypothetical protein
VQATRYSLRWLGTLYKGGSKQTVTNLSAAWEWEREFQVATATTVKGICDRWRSCAHHQPGQRGVSIVLPGNQELTRSMVEAAHEKRNVT